MAYHPTNWKSGAEGGTLVSKARLDNIEAGIQQALAGVPDVALPDVVMETVRADPTTEFAKGLSATIGVAVDGADARNVEILNRDEIVPNTWGPITRVLSQADMLASMGGKTSTYWPYILDAQAAGLVGAPGRYLINWSTDHDLLPDGVTGGTGGIFMAYSDDLFGPYTTYGQVYVDTVLGTQTETPTVLPRLRTPGAVMYYQQKAVEAGAGAQSTMSAVTTDGINWTRRGYALKYPSPFLPRDGHTGYAKVHRFGDVMVAHSLFGGTDYSSEAIWYSRDDETFTLDRRMFIYDVEQTNRIDLRVSMNLTLVRWRGDIWGWSNIKTPSSGIDVAAESENYVARMRPDLRGFDGGFYHASFRPSCFIEIGAALYGLGSDATGVFLRKLSY